jgi:hypothetical protein
MAAFLDLFSPTTYEAFVRSDRTVSGFQRRHEAVAQRVKPVDHFLCYMTKLHAGSESWRSFTDHSSTRRQFSTQRTTRSSCDFM